MNSRHISGEEHPRSKLSDEQVREIRRVWESWRAAGSYKGYGTLGKCFGISMWTARDIVTYATRRSA